MYAEVKDGAVLTWPYNWDNLVKNNPNTSFPVDIAFQDMYAATEAAAAGNRLVRVTEAPKPSFDSATQTVTQAAQPTLKDGEWVLDWVVSQMNADEQSAAKAQKAAIVRAERNAKLSSCDWTQLADSTADKAAWATYRQALRDITKQAGFPWDITWPDAT